MKVFTTTKNGKTVRTTGDMFQFDTLADAGWIQVTSVGQENVYFNWTCDMGHTHKGYCKCL
jgi:hypothetical protein